MFDFFGFFLLGPMGWPAFVTIYWSVSARLKRHFAFDSAVTANGDINWLVMKLLEKMIILEPRPSRFGETKHFRVIF